MKKTALVTGGSGVLGSAIVKKLIQDNWQVAFTWLQNQTSATNLEEASGAKGFKVDLTNPTAVESCIQKITTHLDGIGALVNNAGATQVMPFAMLEAEDWDQILAANLKSMFLVTKEIAREMIGRKSGSIVNIGSIAGHRLLDVPVHYATAKAGVTGFTLALAKEFSRYNIRVNEVVPGLLEGGVGSNVPPKEKEEFLKHVTLSRAGNPDEIADTVSYLLSDKSSYINATSICVDGGI